MSACQENFSVTNRKAATKARGNFALKWLQRATEMDLEGTTGIL